MKVVPEEPLGQNAPRKESKSSPWASVCGALAGCPYGFTLLGHSPLGWACPPMSHPSPSFSSSVILTTDSRGVSAKSTLGSSFTRRLFPNAWFAMYTPYTGLQGMTVSSKEISTETVRCAEQLELRRSRSSQNLAGEVSFANLNEDQSIRRPLGFDVQERKYAYKLARQLAANKCSWAIRTFGWILSFFFKWMFKGEVYVDQNGIDALKNLQKTGTLVFVPTHKSHVDYLMLSYVMFTSGLMCPHIAAGENLSLPIVGEFMRRCGAFFIRRSSKGGEDSQLYKRVLAGYIEALLMHGHSIEFFIEGGRSRDGHINRPKLGLLSYVVDAFLDGDLPRHGNVSIVPVTISYDRPLEERSMMNELLGNPKASESLTGLIKAITGIVFNSIWIWRRDVHRPGEGGHCGCAMVSFGQPIDLKTFFRSRARGLSAQTTCNYRVLDVGGRSQNGRRKSLERGLNQDHDPLLEAFPKGKEERANAVTTLGSAIHAHLRKANVVPATGIVMCAAMLQSMTHQNDIDEQSSGWFSLGDLTECVGWLESNFVKHGGKCMGLDVKNPERASNRIVALAAKLGHYIEMSEVSEQQVSMQMIATPQMGLGVYARLVQILAWLGPQTLVCCAVLAATRGWGVPALMMENSEPAHNSTASAGASHSFAQKENVLAAAVWLRSILCAELDIILGEGAFRTASSFQPILDDLVKSGTLVQWEPPTPVDAGMYTPSIGSGGSHTRMSSADSRQESIDLVIDQLIGHLVDDIERKSRSSLSMTESDVRRYRRVHGEGREEVGVSGRKSIAVMEGVGKDLAEKRVGNNVVRQGGASFDTLASSTKSSEGDSRVEPLIGFGGQAESTGRLYALLLSPIVSTYCAALQAIEIVFKNCEEDEGKVTEKELMVHMQEYLKGSWKIGEGWGPGRCIVPSIMLIRRLLTVLTSGGSKGDEEGGDIPFPMLIKYQPSFQAKGPPRPQDSSVVRRISDMSMESEIINLQNGGSMSGSASSGALADSENRGDSGSSSTKGGIPQASHAYLRLRKEFREGLGFGNLLHRVHMFVLN